MDKPLTSEDKTSMDEINQPNPVFALQEAGRTRDDLPAAAKRALAEAKARRQAAKAAKNPKELGGRDGPEPIRFGDWENKGIASDF